MYSSLLFLAESLAKQHRDVKFSLFSVGEGKEKKNDCMGNKSEVKFRHRQSDMVESGRMVFYVILSTSYKQEMGKYDY
jgi:hypothetical protein